MRPGNTVLTNAAKPCGVLAVMAGYRDRQDKAPRQSNWRKTAGVVGGRARVAAGAPDKAHHRVERDAVTRVVRARIGIWTLRNKFTHLKGKRPRLRVRNSESRPAPRQVYSPCLSLFHVAMEEKLETSCSGGATQEIMSMPHRLSINQSTGGTNCCCACTISFRAPSGVIA